MYVLVEKYESTIKIFRGKMSIWQQVQINKVLKKTNHLSFVGMTTVGCGWINLLVMDELYFDINLYTNDLHHALKNKFYWLYVCNWLILYCYGMNSQI